MAGGEATEPEQQPRTQGRVVSTTRPATTPVPPPARRRTSRNTAVALAFLAPALVLLGALVVYPIFFSTVRSFYDRLGDSFVGLDNYQEMFTSERTLTAIRNNAIWVVVAPTLATGVGLIYAVLAERVRWQTAFKVAVFMPMAISGLATGVIFRLVYEDDPDRGLANAVVTAVGDVFRTSGQYEGARPSRPELLEAQGRAFVTTEAYSPGGGPVTLGLIAIRPAEVPDDAEPALPPSAGAEDDLSGVVWLDFTRGGGGEPGTVDRTELGLPEVEVQALEGGEVVATTTSADDGTFSFDELAPGEYRLRLTEANFRPPWGGVNWLSPTLVTPAIIAAWLWIWIGFAMIVIGAGLAAIPRDVQEAARVDGAGEWQVFRRVTVPLLMPVLLVVLVTLVINVLKVFDLVLIIPPGSVQNDANVIALEMWRVSFGGARDQGLGSALSVLLFLLVLPAMAFNIKRFRAER